MFGIMHQNLCKNNNSNDNRFNYCGTCKSIGSSYGHKSRLFLNYDIVFLSTILNDLQNEVSYSPAYSNKSCWSLPLNNDVPIVFKYTTALNVYLAGIKIKDNIKDSTWYNKIKWFFTSLVFRKSLKSAKKTLNNLGFPVTKVDSLVNDSFEKERRKNLPLSEYVESTAQITSLAFKHGAMLVNATSSDKNRLGEIGSSLGKLAYYIDAKEDLYSDRESKNFNPIIASKKITFDYLVEKSKQQCDLMIDNLAQLNISSSIKSRYLLQVSTLKSEEKKKKEKKNSNSCCFDCCCYIDVCSSCDCSSCNSNSSDDSSCCDSDCGGCSDCSCDGCDCGCDC